MYIGKFNGNILIFGETGCGKTTFIQNLAKNRLFEDLKEKFFLSKITLLNGRQQNILICFNSKVNFGYPQILDEFDMELDLFFFFLKKTDNDADNVISEKNIFNKLIVTIRLC